MRMHLGLQSLRQSGTVTVTPATLDAIVLTKTSASTVNPPEWDSDFTGYILWDSTTSTGDKHLMRWRRVNGGAWTTEVEQGLDDELLTGGFTWPLYEAAKPLAAGYFEAQEQRARYSAGVEVARSDWSNSVTDAALAAPPRLWIPTDLTVDPVHWFDMQDAATVTVDGSTNISAWNDKGTAAANASQATSGNRPAYIASGINTFPVARESSAKGLTFTSSMGSLTSVQFGSGLPNTVIVTLDGTDRSSGATLDALNANNLIGVVWTTTTVTFYQNGTQKAQITGLTIANAGAIFIVGKYNNGGNLNAGRLITNGVLLNRTDLQRYINGDVGEIIYLNYAPTTAERQFLEGYGPWRWAFQALLPGAHPYSGAAPTI